MRILYSHLFVSIALSAFLIFPNASYAQEPGGEQLLRGFLEELLGNQQRQQPQTQRKSNPNSSANNNAYRPKDLTRRIPFGGEDMQLSFAPLVDQTAPSVVNVYAARKVQARRSPFEGDPFFEQFFGRRSGPAQPRVQSSLGSGVIVDRGGLVVTNNHVIEGADEIKVALSDGREYESKVVLRDKRSDLAVLQISEDRLRFPALNFGDSDQLQVGDLVMAIGNPFGVGQTVTTGIVSGVARSKVGVSDFGFFIQTDAAINPGNSGGALIDMSGNLVGINTAIYTRSGGSNGIGFAIPATMVRAVVQQAKGGSGAFERPFFGASFDEVTPAMAESLGMTRPSGAIITDVYPKGPASQAGLRVGDVILSLAGNRIEHPDALGYRLSTLSAGRTVDVDVLSRGRLRNIDVRLAKRPKDTTPQSVTLGGRGPFAGAAVTTVTKSVLRDLRLASDIKGAVVTSIKRGSNAERAGFKAGDVILQVNGRTIRGVRDMREVVADGGRSWRFRLNRRGRILQQFLRY